MGEHGKYRPLVGRAAGVALALAVPSPALACRLALVLALDVSASVDEGEYALQAGGLASALVDAEVQAAFLATPDPVALAVYEWSGRLDQSLILDWTLMDSRDDFAVAAERLAALRRTGEDGPTALGYALGHASTMFRRAPACDRRTIDVSGDGENNHGFGPATAYAHFPLDDVTVNALAVGGAESLTAMVRFYEAQVIKGPGAFVEAARDYSDFARAMRRKLIREVMPQIIGRAGG